MIACVRTPEIFKYELDGQSENNSDHYIMFIIEEPSGEPVGYFQHPNCIGGNGVSRHLVRAQARCLVAGRNSHACAPSVGQGTGICPARWEDLYNLRLILGEQHPAYDALGVNMAVRTPYAWYLRIPDLVGFLHHIRPVLEKRIGEFDCRRSQPRDQNQLLP